MMNAEIAVPIKLTTDDGREIMIQAWTPTVELDSLTTVVIHGTIRLSPEKFSELAHRASWQNP